MKFVVTNSIGPNGLARLDLKFAPFFAGSIFVISKIFGFLAKLPTRTPKYSCRDC
jgi:hypothetical protein